MIQYSLCRIRQSLYIRLLLYDSLCQNPFSPVDIIFAQNVSIIAGILGSQVSVLIIKDLIYIYIKDFFIVYELRDPLVKAVDVGVIEYVVAVRTGGGYMKVPLYKAERESGCIVLYNLPALIFLHGIILIIT